MKIKKLLMLVVVLIATMGFQKSFADNNLSVVNIEAEPGTQVVLPIEMNNTDEICAFQFDLVLPKGVSVAKNNKGKNIITLSERADDHSLSSNINDGIYYVACLSLSSTEFSGNSGVLCNITLDVSESVAGGANTIEIKNIELATPMNTRFKPADISCKLNVAVPSTEVFIDINGVNGTLLKQVVNVGSQCTFMLDNNKTNTKIVKVLFNDTDVTSLVVDGKYTTPVIETNSEIYVEYDNSPLGDTNLDGDVDVADITKTASIILGTGGDEPKKDTHEYVDLGLPSGTLWATCNIGAESPEDYGDYFAWGETTPKSNYDWSTYKYCNGSNTTLTKYCKDSRYGTVDNKTVLEASDDAATANWGSNWRMPTIGEFEELINSSYTTTEWTTLNGVKGRKITSKSNGNSIFLPAAGCRVGTDLLYAGSYGYYWSSSLYSSGLGARKLFFDSSYISTSNNYRYNGLSVRPVRQ